MPLVRQSWYDFPRYFDLAFADETSRECDFFERAFDRYAQRSVRSLLEPACGSGRLVVEMARRGFDMTAFDLNAPSLRFLKKRLRARRLDARVFSADMSAFLLPHDVDGAFSTFNTFRHLVTESAAVSHLRHVARYVKSGGLFILGLHLLPPDADESCIERWTARRGTTRVTTTLRVTASDRRARIERLRVCMLVREPGRELRLRDEFPLRLYTAGQFKRLLAKTPEWELCDVFDFWYDLDEPLELDNDMADTVVVLRRRADTPCLQGQEGQKTGSVKGTIGWDPG